MLLFVPVVLYRVGTTANCMKLGVFPQKALFLRLPPNKVILILKKVVPIPKKVDYIPEIVAYPPNKKSPQKAIFLAHLKKKVYLCGRNRTYSENHVRGTIE